MTAFALLTAARQARLAARNAVAAEDRARFIRRARILLAEARIAKGPKLPSIAQPIAPERVAAVITARVDCAASVLAVADLMLEPAVQAALAKLPGRYRDAVRDHAARRTRALGWDAGTRRRSGRTFRRAA